jgi:hypothetical protein
MAGSSGLATPPLLPALSLVRATAGFLGMNQVSVTLTSWVWTAADGRNDIGTGTPTPNASLPIGDVFPGSGLQNPKVIGTSGDPEVTIDLITPAYYAADGVTQLGGFTPDQLNPLDSPGLEYLYVLGWPQGPRNYALSARGVEFHRPMHYTLHLIAVDRAVPF